MWKSFLARRKGKQHTTKMASSWRISFLIIWLVTSHAMGYLGCFKHTHMSPLLISIQPKHTPSPLLINTNPAHTHVPIAYQHPPSTHPWLRCSPAPTECTHTSPPLGSKHPPRPLLCFSQQWVGAPKLVRNRLPYKVVVAAGVSLW